MRASPRYWVRVQGPTFGRRPGDRGTYWYYTRRRWDYDRRKLRRAGVWYAAGRVVNSQTRRA